MRKKPIAIEPKPPGKRAPSSFGHMRSMGIQLCANEEFFSTAEVWTFDEEHFGPPATL
jgi:hypothetical protein